MKTHFPYQDIGEMSIEKAKLFITCIKNSHILNALNVLNKITEEGYEAYIVGGTVRDILLEKQPHDIDIATNIPMDTISNIWKTHDIGQSKDFGIVTIKEKNTIIEVAQFRQDCQYTNGRRPSSINIVNSFKEDCARRDFTINSMGMDKDYNIIDFHGGQEDIKNKIIKTVGSPTNRFTEDYLRIMRAVRFTATLGFSLDKQTKWATIKLSSRVQQLPVERIYDEVHKAASQEGKIFAKYIELLDSVKVLRFLSPELISLKYLKQSTKHHPEGNLKSRYPGSIWLHTLEALKTNIDTNPIDNLAILFHDIGKATTYELEDGKATYKKHDVVGVKLFNHIADRLKLSNKDREAICFAIENHMKFHLINEMKSSKIFKIVTSPYWNVLVSVAKADSLSRGGEFEYKDEFEKIVKQALEIKNKWEEYLTQKQQTQLIDGNHVMNLVGITTGPLVGKIIKEVSQLLMDGELTEEGIDNEIRNQYEKYRSNFR